MTRTLDRLLDRVLASTSWLFTSRLMVERSPPLSKDLLEAAEQLRQLQVTLSLGVHSPRMTKQAS